MLKPEHLHQLNAQVQEKLSGLKLPNMPEQLIQKLVAQAADKLNLVSQKDYDLLLQIQQRTRQKVDELSAQVAQLEAQIQQK